MLTLPYRFLFQGQPVAWGCMGEGEPLVLIHGTPFSSQVWRTLAPLLAKRWKVYYFDLLGYGLSIQPDQLDVSLRVQNALLADLMAHWGLTTPDVLCHDFGGANALRAYYLNGIRYKRLTIIDAVALAPWGSPFVSHIRNHEPAFTGLPAYAHDALLKAYLQSAAHSQLSDEALRIYMQPWQGEVGQAAVYRQIAQMDQAFTDEIEPLYTPMEIEQGVQVLWGERDEWIPIQQGHKLARLISHKPLIAVPNAGHLMQEDAPESIIAAMLS